MKHVSLGEWFAGRSASENLSKEMKQSRSWNGLDIASVGEQHSLDLPLKY